jgi:hypothetical protein
MTTSDPPVTKRSQSREFDRPGAGRAKRSQSPGCAPSVTKRSQFRGRRADRSQRDRGRMRRPNPMTKAPTEPNDHEGVSRLEGRATPHPNPPPQGGRGTDRGVRMAEAPTEPNAESADRSQRRKRRPKPTPKAPTEANAESADRTQCGKSADRSQPQSLGARAERIFMVLGRTTRPHENACSHAGSRDGIFRASQRSCFGWLGPSLCGSAILLRPRLAVRRGRRRRGGGG